MSSFLLVYVPRDDRASVIGRNDRAGTRDAEGARPPRSAELAEGIRIDYFGRRLECVAQCQRHEVRPGIGRWEPRSVLSRKSKAGIVGRLPEHKDGAAPKLARPVEPHTNDRRSNAGPLPIGG